MGRNSVVNIKPDVDPVIRTRQNDFIVPVIHRQFHLPSLMRKYLQLIKTFYHRRIVISLSVIVWPVGIFVRLLTLYKVFIRGKKNWSPAIKRNIANAFYLDP